MTPKGSQKAATTDDMMMLVTGQTKAQKSLDEVKTSIGKAGAGQKKNLFAAVEGIGASVTAVAEGSKQEKEMLLEIKEQLSEVQKAVVKIEENPGMSMNPFTLLYDFIRSIPWGTLFIVIIAAIGIATVAAPMDVLSQAFLKASAMNGRVYMDPESMHMYVWIGAAVALAVDLIVLIFAFRTVGLCKETLFNNKYSGIAGRAFGFILGPFLTLVLLIVICVVVIVLSMILSTNGLGLFLFDFMDSGCDSLASNAAASAELSLMTIDVGVFQDVSVVDMCNDLDLTESNLGDQQALIAAAMAANRPHGSAEDEAAMDAGMAEAAHAMDAFAHQSKIEQALEVLGGGLTLIVIAQVLLLLGLTSDFIQGLSDLEEKPKKVKQYKGCCKGIVNCFKMILKSIWNFFRTLPYWAILGTAFAVMGYMIASQGWASTKAILDVKLAISDENVDLGLMVAPVVNTVFTLLAFRNNGWCREKFFSTSKESGCMVWLLQAIFGRFVQICMVLLSLIGFFITYGAVVAVQGVGGVLAFIHISCEHLRDEDFIAEHPHFAAATDIFTIPHQNDQHTHVTDWCEADTKEMCKKMAIMASGVALICFGQLIVLLDAQAGLKTLSIEANREDFYEDLDKEDDGTGEKSKA